MSGSNSISLSFRVSSETAEKLSRLASATDRPRSWLLEQALDAYLEMQAWQIAHIEEGLADADAGRTIPHEHVRDWLQTWGREDEGEPPA